MELLVVTRGMEHDGVPKGMHTDFYLGNPGN
jgi:hypothetical protein